MRQITCVAALAAALFLTACGGGGSGGAPTVAPPPDDDLYYYQSLLYDAGDAENAPITSAHDLSERIIVGTPPSWRDTPSLDLVASYASLFSAAAIFEGPITVRIDDRNPEWFALAASAVRALNTALPEGRRMRVAPRGTGELRDGEMAVDFIPRESWPVEKPSHIDGIGANRNSEHGPRAWIDPATVSELLTGRTPDDPNSWTRPEPGRARGLIAHEIMHVLGMVGHFYEWTQPSIMESRQSSEPPAPSLYQIDRLGLFLAYGGDFDEWASVPTRIDGEVSGVQFGVQSVYGLSQSWASLPENTADFGAWARGAGVGTATWSGELVGLTSSLVTVSGDADLTVALDALTGRLAFTDLATPSATWGNGDLHYSVAIEGNSFAQTGGDDGIVTGAFGGSEFGAMGGTLERTDLTAAFGASR